jgi:hypothetical protein
VDSHQAADLQQCDGVRQPMQVKSASIVTHAISLAKLSHEFQEC